MTAADHEAAHKWAELVLRVGTKNKDLDNSARAYLAQEARIAELEAQSQSLAQAVTDLRAARMRDAKEPTPWPDKERGIIEGLEIAEKIAAQQGSWYAVHAVRAEIERRTK